MQVLSFVHEELGNASHLLLLPELGQAIAIDPVRDVGPYLVSAEQQGLRLSLTLETHVHNDFVSGARELAELVGAEIGASANAGLQYPSRALQDGEVIRLGPYQIQVLATPGHTPEHVAYLLTDAAQTPLTLFSGGALMVGTAARTDLFGPAKAWQLASVLEHTLHDRILTLPDHLPVLPTHGSGSFCGVGASPERATTIGNERHNNRLLGAQDHLEFVALALDLGPYPAYYRRMRGLNQIGAPLIGTKRVAPPGLSVTAFDDWTAQGATVLDIRSAHAFWIGHIAGSLAVGADGPLSGWVGWLLGPEQTLLLVADSQEQVDEAVCQLARIGYDRVVGVLEGGLAEWVRAGRPVAKFGYSTAAELGRRLVDGERLVVVDVREAVEWHAGHVPGSVNVPVHDIPARHHEIPRGAQVVVHCGHHYRTTVAASLLEQAGFSSLQVVVDGWEGWTAWWADRPRRAEEPS